MPGQDQTKYEIRSTAEPKTAISIVVPIYNVEKYLSKCLSSLKNQDFTDFEVLMVDDGSPDGSAKIAKRFALKDKRFRYIYQDNAGLGAARNAGLTQSRSDLIMWIDSDDLLLQGCLSKAVGVMRSGKDDFVSFGVYRFSDRLQRLLHSPLHRWVHLEDLRHVDPFDCKHIFRDSTAWNKVFRKSFFEEHVGGWEEGVLFEDLFPVCRAICAARSISVISDQYYIWRQRSERTSITQQRSEIRGLKDRFLALTSIANHLKGRSQAVRTLFLNKFFIVDLPLYRKVAGKGDINYDTAFLQELKKFLDALGNDLALAQSVTPEQKLLCQNLVAMSSAEVMETSLFDLLSSQRYLFGKKQMRLGSNYPETSPRVYDLKADERPRAFKLLKVDFSDESLVLRYTITSLPTEDAMTDENDHLIVVELQNSGHRQYLRPKNVAKNTGFFQDQAMQICDVTIQLDDLVAPDTPTDFNYGRYWRKKVFQISAIEKPDTNTRIRMIKCARAPQKHQVDHQNFDSITVHTARGKGLSCSLRRVPSALRLIGRAKERIQRSLMY